MQAKSPVTSIQIAERKQGEATRIIYQYIPISREPTNTTSILLIKVVESPWRIWKMLFVSFTRSLTTISVSDHLVALKNIKKVSFNSSIWKLWSICLLVESLLECSASDFYCCVALTYISTNTSVHSVFGEDTWRFLLTSVSHGHKRCTSTWKWLWVISCWLHSNELWYHYLKVKTMVRMYVE